MEPLEMSYLEVQRKVPYIGKTIGQQLVIAADTYGDKEMYVFYGENKKRMSFKQVYDEVKNLIKICIHEPWYDK